MAEKADAVRDFLQGLLRPLGAAITVEVVSEPDRFYVDLRGGPQALPEDEGFREALAHLVRLYLRRMRERRGVLLDINGRVRARERELVERARRLAERAAREGRRIELEPMPPAERRLIHLALADHPRVRTYSVGQGAKRHVVIEPRE